MSLPFPLAPYRQAIAAVAVSVYETMLDVAVEETPAPVEPFAPAFTGAVHYAGAWSGALLVECTREQALEWVARLMSLDLPVDREDAVDGMGELTNMIAGNVKAGLPPGVVLSLPMVVEGSGHHLKVCGGNLSEVLYFRDRLGLFRITLVEMISPS